MRKKERQKANNMLFSMQLTKNKKTTNKPFVKKKKKKKKKISVSESYKIIKRKIAKINTIFS